MDIKEICQTLGIKELNQAACSGTQWLESNQGHTITVSSPVDGKAISQVSMATAQQYETIIKQAQSAQSKWQKTPAPHRGEIVRQMALALRTYKDDLGALVSWEMGKSYQEGKGEVQEMIDICDFSVGLSRQLHGLTMHSERPNHRMYEQWHPMGLCGIITAFNFPVAVWSWNAMIAAVCGNVSIWKPSEKTPLTAIACLHIVGKVLKDNQIPEGVMNLVIGDVATIGEPMSTDRRIPLVSATGSTSMGKKVAQAVGKRLGRSILELGGNNAIVISSKADLNLAIPAVVFGAVGTAGQRCTTTRRVIIHEQVYEQVKTSLVKAYQSLKVGSPLDEQNHVGPLIDYEAVKTMQQAIAEAKQQGGNILCGGEPLSEQQYGSKCYVTPCLIEANPEMPICQQETFAPILYLFRYNNSIQEAISIQNQVSQGLSSSIFTENLKESEEFLSHWGSDCGIANVNIGTSGAEIGGAFGGEKDTGGGRESGSDAWKAYMRRQTNTINFGSDMPLAQGINFKL